MACDIVGFLPLELLILVVGYLDLKDILRCGAVCIDRFGMLEYHSDRTYTRSPSGGARLSVVNG